MVRGRESLSAMCQEQVPSCTLHVFTLITGRTLWSPGVSVGNHLLSLVVPRLLIIENVVLLPVKPGLLVCVGWGKSDMDILKKLHHLAAVGGSPMVE